MTETNLTDLDSSFEKLLLESDAEADDNESEESLLENTLRSESSSEEDTFHEDDEEDEEWSTNVITHDSWVFNDAWGINTSILEKCNEPIDFFCQFFNEEVIDLIIHETNRYAMQKDSNWVPITESEIQMFIGLCLQMGIVRLPSLRDYWSSRTVFGGSSLAGKVMTQTRFEKILGNLHLADNSSYDQKNRLYKISAFVQLLNNAFQNAFRPGREVCIDESLVPFRGRILFRQYLPNKRHRYRIKMF